MIGHSLGSVVAYEYLCRDRPASVELLVTLGSPLGIPNVVFDKLTPAPVGGAGAWPGRVAAWVNVADPDDIVALRKDLAPLFPGTHGPGSGRTAWWTTAMSRTPSTVTSTPARPGARSAMSSADRPGLRNGRCSRRAPRPTTARTSRPWTRSRKLSATVVEALKGLGFTTVARPPGYRLDPALASLRDGGAQSRSGGASGRGVLHRPRRRPGTRHLLPGRQEVTARRPRRLSAGRPGSAELLTLRDDHGEAPRRPAHGAGHPGLLLLRLRRDGDARARRWRDRQPQHLGDRQRRARWSTPSRACSPRRSATRCSGPRPARRSASCSLDSLVQAINDAHAGQAQQQARLFVPATGSDWHPAVLPQPRLPAGPGGPDRRRPAALAVPGARRPGGIHDRVLPHRQDRAAAGGRGPRHVDDRSRPQRPGRGHRQPGHREVGPAGPAGAAHRTSPAARNCCAPPSPAP